MTKILKKAIKILTNLETLISLISNNHSRETYSKYQQQVQVMLHLDIQLL